MYILNVSDLTKIVLFVALISGDSSQTIKCGANMKIILEQMFIIDSKIFENAPKVLHSIALF